MKINDTYQSSTKEYCKEDDSPIVKLGMADLMN